MEQKKLYNLEERLTNFAVSCTRVAECLPNNFAGSHLANQLTRSGSAPALHYGEAQGAESARDFIHKMKVALKELRETKNCLSIIIKLNWGLSIDIKKAYDESCELIRIFFKSISTAESNRNRGTEKHPISK